MSNYKIISRFLKLVFEKNKSSAIVAFFMMMVIAILDLVIPQITRQILDDAIGKHKIDLLIKLILLYLFMSILSSIFNVLLKYIYSKMKKKVSSKLKLKILKHLSKLSGDHYINIKTGNIFSILENDIFIVENFGAETLFSLIIDMISACIAVFFLARMQFDLLLIVIVIQLCIILSQFKFTKIIYSKTKDIRQGDGNLSNIIQEYISNIMNVIISKSKFNFFTKYIKQQKSLISKYIKLDIIISSNISISTLLNDLITISIYGYGGIKIIKGHMSIGELIAFQQYVRLLIGPCVRIIRSNTRIQQSIVSINRIFSILDEPIAIKQNNKGNRITENFNGDIVFKNVTFAYEFEKILDSINLEFKRGSITAIIGSSGCGKSTIAKLLFRLWDINDGKILIDNIDIKDYNLKDLRKNISIVTQDLLLLDDSILNNLTLGNKNIDKEYVKEVCNKVGIYNFICNLPNGFNTVIGEKGVKLSGGQKQRIAITRALISDSRIIIFDEATSALDNVSQKNILENIGDFLKDKTVIVIAHRLSTIRNANKIYVINKGKVIEEGSHNKLLSSKGIYYDMLDENILA